MTDIPYGSGSNTDPNIIIAEWASHIVQLEDENKRLQAENERLRKENKRLYHDGWFDDSR